MNSGMNDDDLTPDERAAFAELPRERCPSDLLEERTVGALRAAGLLGDRRRRGWALTWTRAAAAAAVMALMLGSFVLGRQVGAREGAAGLAGGGALAEGAQADVAAPGAAPGAAGPLGTAAEVQRAGSDYIAALGRLSLATATSDSAAALQGREVAIATLLGAAQLLMRLDPNQPVARSLLASLGPPGSAPADTARSSRRDIVWF